MPTRGSIEGSLGTLKILSAVAKKYYKKVLWRVLWRFHNVPELWQKSTTKKFYGGYYGSSIMFPSCGKKVLQKSSMEGIMGVP